MNEKVTLADQNSTKIQQDVVKALEQVQGGLEESLKNAKDELSKMLITKYQLNEKESDIIK